MLQFLITYKTNLYVGREIQQKHEIPSFAQNDE